MNEISNVRKRLYWFLFITISTLALVWSLIHPVDAKKGGYKLKKGETLTTLEQVENLYMISQDLNDNAIMYLNSDSACYCSCRDGAWSCTELQCDMHLKSCGGIQTATRKIEPQNNLYPAQNHSQNFSGQSISIEPQELNANQNTQIIPQNSDYPNYSSQLETSERQLQDPDPRFAIPNSGEKPETRVPFIDMKY